MKVEEKLAVNAFKNDEESHIVINHEVCRARCRIRYCLYVCPAGLYSLDEDKEEVRVEFAGCLECGTCRACCPHEALQWRYPKGGFGIRYRYG